MGALEAGGRGESDGHLFGPETLVAVGGVGESGGDVVWAHPEDSVYTWGWIMKGRETQGLA